MKEFSFIYEKKLQPKFNKLKEKLCKFSGEVFVQNLKQTNNNLLIIAIKDELFIKQKKLFYDFATDIIINNYKKEYIETMLNSIKFNDIKWRVFVECLKNYDNKYEREQIYNNLNFNHDINLKSYTYFKMNFLIKKWQEMCSISLDNSEILKDYEIYKNLINFLFGKNDETNVCVSVKPIRKSLYKVSWNKKNAIFKNKDLLLWLINLNPKQILLNKTNENFNNELITSIFYDLFAKKIININKKVDNVVNQDYNNVV